MRPVTHHPSRADLAARITPRPARARAARARLAAPNALAAVAAVAAAIALLGHAPAAAAHHSSLAPLRPTPAPGWQADSAVQTRPLVTRLEVDELPATAWTWLLAARVRLGRGLDLRLRLPVHMLDVEGMSGRRGAGDASAGVGWTARDRGRLALSAAVDVFAPVGDGASGLGGGAFAVEPTAHAAYAIAPAWRIVADTGLFAQLGEYDSGLARIDRYASTELSVAAGLARAGRRTWARGGVRAIAALAPSSVAGEVFAASEAAVSARAVGDLWVTANAEVPLHAAGKFDWRVGAGVSWRFGQLARVAPAATAITARRACSGC